VNGAGKPFVFLTRSVPGATPILWVGNQKYELDQGTCLHWLKELSDYFHEELRELERRNH
jgi:hypothetical protein